jgi:hypothetical protein
MNALDWILKLLGLGAGEGPAVKAALLEAVAKLPDLAGVLNPIIAKLDQAVDPANLAAVGGAVPGELLNIAQGKLDPRPHPGDGI